MGNDVYRGYEDVGENSDSHLKKLPPKRKSEIYKFRIGSHKIFLGTGDYDDGSLGEIFVDLHKSGTVIRSLLNCFAIAVSLGLQYGVPLKTYVDIFSHMRFEPNGDVKGYKGIKRGASFVDVIFRILGKEYINSEGFLDSDGEL